MNFKKLTSSRIYDLLIYLFLTLQVASVFFSIAVSSVSFAITGLLFVFKVLSNRNEIKGLKTTLDLFFLAFVVVEILSAIFSEYRAEAFSHARRVLLISVFYMAIFVLKDAKRIYSTILGLGIVAAIISIIELVVYYFRVDVYWLGVFQISMTAGELKMIILLLLFPLYLDREIAFKKRALVLLLIAPIYLTFLLTFVRSAWLGFSLGLMAIVLLKYRSFFPGWAFLVAVFYFFFPLKYQYAQFSDVTKSETTVARYMMWKTGVRMFAHKPLLGYGDIDLYKIYLRFRPNPAPDERHGHLHNNFIMWLVLFGIVGFAVLSGLFIKMLIDMFVFYKSFASIPMLRDFILAGIGIFFAFHVSGMFEWSFGDAEIMTSFWFVSGIVYSVNKNLKRQNEPQT
ncbi:O-antigen ligase [Candidatus Kryptonium thompsonii]|nr:O-antigen ligase [Candidatus Kryptonium thompsoni]